MRFLNGCLAGGLTAALTALAVWGFGQRIAKPAHSENTWIEDRLAESIVDGQSVLFPAQVDEATLRWATAERLTKAPDVAVFGSSHGLQISSEFSAPYQLSNFCISGGSFPDHLVTTYILEQHKVRPRVWLIFVDPWHFNMDLDFLMWRARAHQLSAMEAQLADGDANFPKVFRERAADVSRPKLRNRYSLDPFVAAIDDFFRQNFESIVPAKSGDALGTVLQPDGSIQPAGNRREIDVAEAHALAVRQYAQNRDRHRYGSFSHVDEGLWKIFESWLKFAQSDGAEIVLILPPYHPAVYSRAVQDPKNHLREVEKRIRELVPHLQHVTLVGSYDPAAAGVSEVHFFDGDHLREDGLHLVLGNVLSEAAKRATMPTSTPNPPAGSP